jgi:hypothetical protein
VVDGDEGEGRDLIGLRFWRDPMGGGFNQKWLRRFRVCFYFQKRLMEFLGLRFWRDPWSGGASTKNGYDAFASVFISKIALPNTFGTLFWK